MDLAEQAAGLAALRAAVRAGGLPTAHDLSEGGLAVALAECCIAGGMGARVDLSAIVEAAGDARTALFGEGPGGALVAGPAAVVGGLAGARVIGTVGGDRLQIERGWPTSTWPRFASASKGRSPLPSPDPYGGRRPLALVASAGAGNLGAALFEAPPPGMIRDLDHRDGPRDECGVFGVYAPESDVSRLAYFALFALQHRGQESAGIAACDDGHIMTVRDLGLVSQVFDEEKLRALRGQMALGHVRYSTTGSSAWENAQPVWRSDRRQVALAHNGNLINAVELHSELTDAGVQFRGTSDSEIIAALLSTHEAERIEDALAEVMPRLEGAFSTVVMTKDAVVAFRDGAGLRPLSLGHARRQLLRGLRELRVRHHRRRAGPRGPAGRDGLARASAASRRGRSSTPTGRRSASSSTSTSRGRTRSSRATARRSRAARWARSSGARRRSRPTW